MWQQTRKARRERQKKKVKFFIFLLVILFLSLILITFSYKKLFYPKGSFLNPVSKESLDKESKLNQLLNGKNIGFVNTSMLYDSSYLVNLKDGEQVIFSGKKNLDIQVSSLQLMLTRLKIEGKKFKILDFRYDNPVVSF